METTDKPISQRNDSPSYETRNGDGTLKSNKEGKFKSRLLEAGILPPSGFFGRVLTRGLLVLLIWAVLWSIIGEDALPGGNIFGIFIVIVCASLFGFLVGRIPYLHLPPLLGMLLAGFLLRNVRGIDVARHIDKRWSSTLRSMALVVILIRSGLGLNTSALRKLKFTLSRLAFLPCILEAVTAAILVHLLLDMKWLWAFQLGFVQAAVSLAVVIPCLLDLQEQHYGVDKGIPTLVMAAASFDNVLCISAFGVCLGIAFDSGNLIFSIFRGPIELVLGITVGCLAGVLCWFFPNKNEANVSHNRLVILLSFSLLSVFGSNVAKFSGAGALGVLTMSTVAAYGWCQKGKAPVAMVMSLVWQVFEPLLFGLVGAEVSVEYMNSKVVGMGIASLFISLIIRLITTYLGLLGNDLNLKERLFIAMAWLPKATVQAAIGSVSLDVARQNGFTGQIEEEYGIQILTIAVLVILITSPIGAIGIVVAGPRMLHRSPIQEVDDDFNESPGPATERRETRVIESMGIASLFISLIIRLITTYLGLLGNDLNLKERLFIAMAWLPKATVQAAIGSVSLDVARQNGFTGQIEEEYGIQILTIAVLVILITSPIGAIGIVVAGPRMLHRSPIQEVDDDFNESPGPATERRETRVIESTV